MIPIHKGPSKWDLMLVMFDPAPLGIRRAVSFQSEDGDEMEIVIETLKCNPASNFVFAGWVKESHVVNLLNKYVVGNYNTQYRNGELSVYPTEHGLPRI